MSTALTPTPMENKFLSIVGVAGFCYAVLWISPNTLIAHALSYTHTFFFLRFEEHFWQYALAFIAVIVLSRGHLWSYGINSQNLKLSMVWLAWFYGCSITATIAAFFLGFEFLPIEASVLPGNTSETVIMMAVFWMSSPVANQILFFGFGQTILMKQWGDSITIAKIPVIIFFSSIFFTIGATTSQFYFGEYSFLFTFALGVYCGIVYWKTHSLITPMLAHAFYFGFPLFIHVVRFGIHR